MWEPCPDAHALECIELQACLVGDFGGNAAQRVGRPGRHGGRARRAAVLGSSRASTPVGPSRARLVDQISVLDVRSLFADGSLLAALSRGARGCALCAATSQPDREARYVHPRDGRLEGRCYPTEGVPHSPPSRRRLDCGEALGARSAASAIAPAAGAGVALMRPRAIGAISPPTARPLPRDCLLRLFADPDDNTTKRTIS